MAEIRDAALLLRRIPYSETSLICHFLTEQHGRVTLMAKGSRRPKSAFRATLEPLHALQISWRPGRSGMGTLTDIYRGEAYLDVAQSLDGLELLAISSRLFQEGDPHGFAETRDSLLMLSQRKKEQGLSAAVWQMLDVGGWLGNLSHCWQCGCESQQSMHWQQAQLLCGECGKQGLTVSVGLRKSIAGIVAGQSVKMNAQDGSTWREMIRLVLKEHGVKVTESFT